MIHDKRRYGCITCVRCVAGTICYNLLGYGMKVDMQANHEKGLAFIPRYIACGLLSAKVFFRIGSSFVLITRSVEHLFEEVRGTKTDLFLFVPSFFSFRSVKSKKTRRTLMLFLGIAVPLHIMMTQNNNFLLLGHHWTVNRAQVGNFGKSNDLIQIFSLERKEGVGGLQVCSQKKLY
ncbi:hypothetical protein BD770DRAFT_389505 [Pilaira anomala]|nr:hypothetical protein BD770DRAFT_389505 [Pilaira anomala]